MSQYIDFYIKTKDNKYINLFDYSRNSAIYEYAEDYIECDMGRLLDINLINTIINSLKEEDSKYEPELNKLNNRINIVSNFNNSVEDKMEEIHSIENQIEELKELHEQLKSAINFYQTLYDIVDNFKWNDEGSELWAGIEWNPNYKEEQ